MNLMLTEPIFPNFAQTNNICYYSVSISVDFRFQYFWILFCSVGDSSKSGTLEIENIISKTMMWGYFDFCLWILDTWRGVYT